ncbi:O-antigen ligase family protein [Simkania sp.]|uniref:O-antigen ligase family protein n=1 Tax=Simkania sp. TaxID=34094 RepID=UPI003B52C903
MNFANFRVFLIYLFVFLGPLGNLLCPSFLPYQFRAFYFVLPAFFLFYTKLYYKELKTLLLFLPFFLYALASAYFCINRPALHFEETLVSRVGLFACEVLFMFGAAFCLRDRLMAEEKKRLIRIYLAAFFISVLVGYALFAGYYLKVFSWETVDKFTVITQKGWGILRFSPGSYPNEYGIVASFVASILLLLIVERKNPTFQLGLSKKSLYCFFGLTLGALLLSTTRAAYLAFVFALLYIFCVSKSFRYLSFLGLAVVMVFFIMMGDRLELVLEILTSSFKPSHYKDVSMQLRFEHWQESLDAFNTFPLFGRGFGTLFYVHNVYIELFAELGLIGCLTLLFFGLAYFFQHQIGIKKIFRKRWASAEELFSNRVIVLGLIHVFSFALTNHNINHHLTWMVFLLFNMSLFARKPDTSLQQAF